MEGKMTEDDLDMEIFKIRHASILDGIKDAAKKATRDPSGIEVMAVSKFQPFSAIRIAYNAGLRRFGESRVQEAFGKFMDFRSDCPEASFEMIGHIQSNKAAKAAGIFDCIQSVDSCELLTELGRQAAAVRKTIRILLELHTAEDSKAGFSDKDTLFKACELMTNSSLSETLIPVGLMTMAPFTQDSGKVRSSFSLCRETFGEIVSLFDFPSFSTLSMGMSSDYRIAIEEGSTLVRIGSALFGERIP
ncbi:MAG: YggS family pyridoxal phosphate-dependent enzyme [Rectinemataceae bacterium]|nr:YggS family pyridoxal phosphate-dependent enzyme [Rectinemataceae bacterium]